MAAQQQQQRFSIFALRFVFAAMIFKKRPKRHDHNLFRCHK
jgi:hypothetical protein